MQTVETLNEGLKRAYTLTIPAAEITAKVDAEVKRAAPEVRMPGFRPGKVPANLIKKMHGPALERDALNSAVQEGVQSLIAEQGLRPAMQPQVELDDYEPGKNAEVKVTLEVLPQVPAPSIDGLTLERLTVEPEDSAIDALIGRFAAQQQSFEPALDGHPAVEGDQVVVDFVGKTEDGVAFPGGTGEDMPVELGSGRLIPGFEAQLEGVKVGEEKTLHVTFPENYGEKSLAGKPATFDITLKAINTPKAATIDDEFAKSLGLEGLDKLRELFKGQVEQELNGLTRTHMKRKLLDQLAAGHDFPVPPSMVEAEFQQIWQQLEHEATHEADPAAAMAEVEKERDDYVAIAERRVRLGLLLSEIGQQNGVEVSGQEMQRLATQAAQQYAPKDRERFMEYVQQDPIAAAQLRAPLYEDKVVDFLFDKAEVTDRAVTRAELEAAIESEDGFATGTHVHDHHDHDHDHHSHDHGHDHDHHGHDHDAAEPAEQAAEASAEAEPAPAKKPAAKRTKKSESVSEASAEEAPELAEATPAPKKRAAKKKTEAEG
ncbi:trigger factor [Sphingomonas nostoxanthinifaciens]|uniref:trigger factor n=1 Tax=Sphingomonas nostoxanthinifaciens TaxID=2872652 RepID=UPI001CC1D9FD|nr:trigger factor [Sphingomonas nostoxanthinifaciens]UAK24318.1 trigger factor [Sphingomonas nostoxanthinifaciens]